MQCNSTLMGSVLMLQLTQQRGVPAIIHKVTKGEAA